MCLIERIRHARDRQLVFTGELSGFSLAALAGLPGPTALTGDPGELCGRDLNGDGVSVREDVILLGAAPRKSAFAGRRIAAGPAVDLVAIVVERLRGPAEPALLIMWPCGVGAFVGARRIFTVGIIELALDAPNDVRRKRTLATDRIEGGLVQGERAGTFEETERVLDLPDQVGRRRRLCPARAQKTDENSSRRECVPTHDVPSAATPTERL